MSSSARLSTTQPAPAVTSSIDTTTKKKFGKNLNKLTAPPVAPVAQGSKLNSSSKNGFLLLSTKRPSSGNNSGTASGGILSSKSAQNTAKPIPSLGLHTEFASSTHDALLGVVVGASRLENQQQPDAWGVAEKQQQEQSQHTQLPKNDDAASNGKRGGMHGENHNSLKNKSASESPAKVKNERETQENEAGRTDSDNLHSEYRTSNWDEYGGRDLHTNDDATLNETSRTDEGTDVQEAFMKSLARKRAEKRRDEEESRMIEQKERAALRLRELEEKMARKKKEDSGSMVGKEAKNTDDHIYESKIHSKVVLEKLKLKDNVTGLVSPPPARPQRTLYDPSVSGKSYSSLVGGSHAMKQDRTLKSQDAPVKFQSLTVPSSKKNGSQPQQGTYSADPESFDRQSVIQIASYEDRDRGDRNATAAPRMLFDPKSGSMVEVMSRDDSTTNGRNRKAGKKTKSLRDKNSKKDLAVESNNIESKGRRKLKGNKDCSANQRSKGGTGESLHSKKDLISKPKKLNISDPRQLPRTCGVLYSRDKKGGFVCSDGCEGDLGYGVHSVPGGRVKNSAAYLNYVESQKQIKEEEMANYDGMNHDEVMLEMGFHIAEAKAPKHEWIKPNEKIELITGDGYSPTLQATAREWAPSHTPFSISDHGKMALSSTGSSEDEEDEDEDLDEDEVAPLGLGFDPALNMDSVMQSPSMDPSDRLGAVDLTTISLEPALKGASQNSHIFAFESGATWGAGNSQGSNDWGMHSGNSFGTTTNQNGGVPASFLSLSTGSSTWGGFGTSLNGDNANSSGE